MDEAEGNVRGELRGPKYVAAIFRVNPRTVTRWAQAGRLPFVVTPGGQHKFYDADVRKLLAESGVGPRS